MNKQPEPEFMTALKSAVRHGAIDWPKISEEKPMKKQINMKFSPELLKRMDTAAQNRGQTRTKLVELAVLAWLEPKKRNK